VKKEAIFSHIEHMGANRVMLTNQTCQTHNSSQRQSLFSRLYNQKTHSNCSAMKHSHVWSVSYYTHTCAIALFAQLFQPFSLTSH